MRKSLSLCLAILLAVCAQPASALTKAELEERQKQLPTVPESEMPDLSNEATAFPGIISHPELQGSTWVTYPFVENPGSFGLDEKGRIYVAETHRFWLGVPDLRGKNELVREDFQAITVEDRAAMYERHADAFPEGWFTANAERIVLLEDRDGNGAADHRSVFADSFNDPLDGVGFSVLPHDGDVYFTCIPKVWKMTDEDGDGVADETTAIAEGFGVRVSFIGHDLHGIIVGPDGKLYFSVGDRGYHVTTDEGEVFADSGKGAIFRCEPDGSDFEVYARGLRNPQELAFDDHGNLFTFDNTGDIGDVARMVYALDGSDSGWDMSHQSAHHYVDILDWGDFHPEKSMWVAEEMFETWNETQPQWVYPPASHVARGPSGVTWLTGEAIPKNLRNRFLLANYRGAAVNCTALSIQVEPSGAGFVAVSEEEVIKGVGVTDVEQGRDGKIYICDWGGGWSINVDGAIRVLESTNPDEVAAGKAVAAFYEKGFGEMKTADLHGLLSHADRRLRQDAQFELVKRGGEGLKTLKTVAMDSSAETISRLHAIWGVGQLMRQGEAGDEAMLGLLEDADAEVKANVIRLLGDLNHEGARDAVLPLLKDENARVRSLAAVALGRIAEAGDSEVIEAIFELVERNGAEERDVVIRHSCLGALARLEAAKAAVSRADSESQEARLMAVLVLRRLEDPALKTFLKDADPLVQREAARAVYDTAVADTETGDALGAMGTEAAQFPATVQRRIVAQNFRRGQAPHARMLLAMAAKTELAAETRRAALIGLLKWATPPQTDSVHGHYRPIEVADRDMEELGSYIGEELKSYLAKEQDAALISLAMKLADASGVVLDPDILRAQIANAELDPEIRVAALDSLVATRGNSASDKVNALLKSETPALQAAAFRHAFDMELDQIEAKGLATITGDYPIGVARASIEGLASANPAALLKLWKDRGNAVSSELWLDLFLSLEGSGDETAMKEVSSWSTEQMHNRFTLSETGGDPLRGEQIFRNQGACMQCHMIKNEGGIQGPPLDELGKRLSREDILVSLYDPNAVITEGYGLSSITMKDGSLQAGRILKEDDSTMSILTLDNRELDLKKDEVATIAPPVSAMPPMALSLPPRDLRDLVAYLAEGTVKGGKKKDASKHGGDEEEKIVK